MAIEPLEQRPSSTARDLVICRDLPGVDALTRLDPNRRYVVASDDPRVHAAAAAIRQVDAVVFLEKMESIFAVAEDVRSTLAALNDWLASLGSPEDVPAELLFWASHAEAGVATQRIQDGLLLVRSYRELLEREMPRRAYVVISGDSSWEDEIFVACAKELGTEVEIVYAGIWSSARHWLSRTWQFWRPFAKEAVQVFRIMRSWRAPILGEPTPNASPLVAIQLCDSAPKHVDLVGPLARELSAAGLQPVVCGWSAGSAIARLRTDGHAAEALERWVTRRALVRSWIVSARVLRRAGRERDAFLPPRAGRTDERMVRSTLLRSLRAFLIGDLAHRVRLDGACRRFFSAYPPRAAKLWTRVLPQGVIAYRALPTGPAPLLFWQPGWPYTVREPLRDYPVPANLVFALSGEHRKRLLAEGVPDGDIVVAGLPWLEEVRAFAQTHSKAMSRRELGIRENASMYVMFDPGYVLRGYKTRAEDMFQLEAVLDVAESLPEIQVIVKPHPARSRGELESILAARALPNVAYVPKNGPTYHVLNAVDLVITKMSTLAIEAMCMDTPSICLLFDGELEFRAYEDGVDYALTVQEAKAKLMHLARDATHRQAWRAETLARAAEYLRRHDLDVTGNPNRAIAETLLERLSA